MSLLQGVRTDWKTDILSLVGKSVVHTAGFVAEACKAFSVALPLLLPALKMSGILNEKADDTNGNWQVESMTPPL